MALVAESALDRLGGDLVDAHVAGAHVARHEYPEMPPRVEYELTELGRTLHAPLQASGRWAEEHMAEVLAARETYDAGS